VVEVSSRARVTSGVPVLGRARRHYSVYFNFFNFFDLFNFFTLWTLAPL
jgi:hypothetical protein